MSAGHVNSVMSFAPSGIPLASFCVPSVVAFFFSASELKRVSCVCMCWKSESVMERSSSVVEADKEDDEGVEVESEEDEDEEDAFF